MRSPSFNSDDAMRRIDLAAAEWLVRRDRGFTAAEQDEFLQWIAADARHGEWFTRHQHTWREFNLLAQWRPEHSAEPNPDLLARPRSRRRWPAPVSLAIAASLALGFTLWPVFAPTSSPRSAVPALANVAETYERRSLPDGSVVELNRGGVIDVRFSSAERRVRLMQGEAHFTVTKDPNRPFLVRAGALDVRAIGTAFNVRLEPSLVEVLVTEGRVGLERAPDASPESQSRSSPPKAPQPIERAARPAVTSIAELVANERARISLTEFSLAVPVIERVSAAAIRAALDWQPQLLDFNSTPLGEVLDEFNRRNSGRVRLVLADPTLGAIPIVASIRSDNVEGFVRLLQSAAGIRADDRGNGEMVLRKSPAATEGNGVER
jgi:transmembrane sensor